MEILLGQNSAGNGLAAVSITKPVGFRFQAPKTGVGQQITVHLEGGSTATEIWLAVAPDGTEGKVPGTVQAQQKVAIPEQTESITGLTVNVVGGTWYWLIVGPVSGTIKLKRQKEEAGEAHRSVIGVKISVLEPNKVTEWTQEQTGPMQIFMEGEPASPIPFAAASSTSGGAAAVNAPTLIEPGPASSSSGAVGALGHPALISGTASSESGAAAAVTTPTRLPFAAAVSSSAASATVRNGIEIPYGPEPQQVTDLWPASTPGSPIVIFVHGGGWTIDQLTTTRPDAEAFWETTKWMVLNADYRVATSAVGAFPKQVEDLEAAIAFAISKASAYNGATSRIYLVSGSAGAHLATMAANRINAESTVIRGVACLSGIYDLEQMMREMETGAYREEPWGSFADGVFSNSGGVGFLESATAAFQAANVGYIVKSTGHATAKTYVKAIISPTKVELSTEVTAGSGATFALNHAGGSVDNLSENIQEALQQNLVYTGGYTGEAGVAKPNESNPASTTEASRSKQREWSPSRGPVPKGCRYLLLAALYDLIPPNQLEAMQARLEEEGCPVQVRFIEGTFNPGHAFSYWASQVTPPGKNVKLTLQAWIEEPEPAIVKPAAGSSTSAASLVLGARAGLLVAPASSTSTAIGAVVLGVPPPPEPSVAFGGGSRQLLEATGAAEPILQGMGGAH